MVAAAALLCRGLFVFCVTAGALRLLNLIRDFTAVRSQGAIVGRICSGFCNHTRVYFTPYTVGLGVWAVFIYCPHPLKFFQ